MLNVIVNMALNRAEMEENDSCSQLQSLGSRLCCCCCYCFFHVKIIHMLHGCSLIGHSFADLSSLELPDFYT